MIRILGIDPGFASLGIARLVQADGGAISAEAIRTITTKKATKKERVALRVSADDVQRSRKLWEPMRELADGVQAIAYEVYTPFSGSGRGGSGSKTALACGLALGLGFSLDVPVIPILPSDIKRELVGRKSASKADVSEILCTRVAGLGEQLEDLRATRREHASDAAAVALIGLLEINRLRSMAIAHERGLHGSR